MQTFALTGAAGYVAPRHMQAILDTGNSLVAVLDPHDTLGVMDRYFPEAECFSSDHLFHQFIQGSGINYLTVCSPNHLHFQHMKMGMQSGAHIICEKPLVIDPAQLQPLEELEQIHHRQIKTILQLRLLPTVQAIRNALANNTTQHIVDVQYITSRGKWYQHSWKGKDELSGGLVTNIGIHLFDLLIWLFGAVEDVKVHQRNECSVQGELRLERAQVSWKLSIDASELPASAFKLGSKTFRAIRIDGQECKLDDGLEGLHTQCYREILAGNGPGLTEASPSIHLCHKILHI
jgi:UDP-N-acetyl-2-amino-2-deoxyglucuronate dehydrogenase